MTLTPRTPLARQAAAAAAARRHPLDRVHGALRVIERHVEQRPACEDDGPQGAFVVQSAAHTLRPFRRTPRDA